MTTNYYFNQHERSDQVLYEDIIIESIKMYGQDVYYLPRDLVEEDKVWAHDAGSKFNSSYRVEMYIENVEGFDGEGDLFTKFGVEIRDQATFIVSRRRWSQTVKSYDNEITGERPREGDVLYIPFSKKLFQIMHVEHEQPFYQLMNLPTYKLRCELFEFSNEIFETENADIDQIARDIAYNVVLTISGTEGKDFTVGEEFRMALTDTLDVIGTLSKWDAANTQITLINVRSTEEGYHNFTINRDIQYVPTSEYFNVTGVADALAQQPTAQNDFFQSLTDFLDFSESNPFGDPE